MGRKKRNVVNRSKPSKSPSPAADPPSSNPNNSPDNSPAVDAPFSNPDNALGNSPAADPPSSNPDNALGNSPAADAAAKSEVTDLERYSSAKPSLSHSAIKLECQRALTALRRGNYTRALRLMNDFSSKYGNSPHASLIHRVHGIVCVKVAFLMEDTNAKQRHLRNAIESARKAAMLCPNSVEFGLFYASLMYEAANEAKEYEEVVQECKRALAIENPVDPAEEGLQEESQNKISTAEERVARVQIELRSLIQKSVLASLKALEIREENFWPIPITRVPEDPNEIKKVAKAPEECRKEIEERVTAARFVQQNSEYAQLKNEGDNTKNDSKGSENGPGSGSRKNTSTDERRDLVRTFWISMNLDGKKECLRIKISDLKAHFSSSKDGLPSEMLDEALSFGETNKVWRFWECCRCNEKFADSGSLMEHVVQGHMRSLLPKTQSVLPQNVDNEWAKMLLNIPWKPLDLNASITMHQKQSKPDLLDESSASQNADEYECDGDQSKNWPVSDDAERAKLLERIHSIFESLIRHKYMASSHVSKIMNFAVEDPLSICFLGAPRLEKILIFLQEISQACGLNRYSDKSKGGDDTNTAMHSIDDTLEKIVFSSDASFLVLDEHFLPDKIPRGDGVNNASSALTSSHGSYDNGGILDSDALLSWIFSGASSSEQLASWQHERAEKAQQGMEILQLLEEESSHLRNLCERKREQLSYEAALQALGDRCLEEGKKRVHVADFVFQSYDSVLNKRREELIENENGLTVMSNIVELDAISNVLADADSVNINRCVTSLLCALESGGGDERRTKDYMQQMDSYIEAAIQKQKEAVSVEISRIDARLMRIIAEKQKLEVELGRASSHDFRSILIPLVKSFMGARLEDLAEKDAVEKSDAAREAILAELALDSKKVSAGVDSSRHSHDRTKDKKKSKDNRKNKDSKVINSDELQDQTAEEIVLPSAHGEGGPGSVIAVPAPDDDALQLNDEEYKRRIEIEAEERKLEEMLEYQRRIENEAKQKRLAEKQQELSRIVSDSTETVAMADDEKYASEHSKESLVHKDGFADTVDGIEQVTNSDELQDPTAE